MSAPKNSCVLFFFPNSFPAAAMKFYTTESNIGFAALYGMVDCLLVTAWV
jgi:hypothetical protein